MSKQREIIGRDYREVWKDLQAYESAGCWERGEPGWVSNLCIRFGWYAGGAELLMYAYRYVAEEAMEKSYMYDGLCK